MAKRRAGRPKGSCNKKTLAAKCETTATITPENAPINTMPASVVELAVRFSGVVQDIAKLTATMTQLITGINDMGGNISRDMGKLTERIVALEMHNTQASMPKMNGPVGQKLHAVTNSPKLAETVAEKVSTESLI